MTTGDRLPNFIIAGAPRCGTSAAFAYFAAHPDVAFSSVKEVQYFMDRSSALFHAEANSLDHGLDRYTPFFSTSLAAKPAASILMEATPGYLYQAEALAVLPGLASRPKCLFILRRPSRQLYSSYIFSLHQAGNLAKDVPFAEFAFGSDRMRASENEFHRHALDFVRYNDYLRNWRDVLDKDRIHVVTFEDFSRDLPSQMKSICEWLGIDPGFYDAYSFQRENANVVIRSRGLQAAARMGRQLLSPALAARAKTFYAKINKAKFEVGDDLPLALMDEIDLAVRPSTMELGQSFDIDLSKWLGPLAAS